MSFVELPLDGAWSGDHATILSVPPPYALTGFGWQATFLGGLTHGTASWA